MGAVFIESICTDPEVVQREMRIKVGLSDDFKGLSHDEAIKDLADRIAHYEPTYQTVREAEGAYIKVFDMRAKVHAVNVYGRMAKSVLPFVMALHFLTRPVLLLSVDEEASAVGALRDAGGALPAGLAQWISSFDRAHELLVFASTQPRAKALAAAVAAAAGAPPPAHRATLAPLQRTDDPDQPPESFRKAFGENVSDLVMRLEPIVLELEGATAPVLVITHEGACRALRAYLLNLATHMSITERERVDASVDMGAPVLREFSPTMEGGPVSERLHAF